MSKRTAEDKLWEQIAAMDGCTSIEYIGLDRMRFVSSPRYDLSWPRKPPQVVEVPRRVFQRWQDRRDQESMVSAKELLQSGPASDAAYLDLIVDRQAKSVRRKGEAAIVDFSGAKEQWQCFVCHYQVRESGLATKEYANGRKQTLAAARAVVSEVNGRLAILKVRLVHQRGRRKLVSCE